ncbi:ANTAR domain-containing protein [Streptomyces sp. YKOK-I1]
MPNGPGETDESRRIAQPEGEAGQQKEAVTSHAVVDQAIGMMVALGRVPRDRGWAVLKDVSQHTDIRLRHVAELILIWARKGGIPSDIRAEPADALGRHGPTQMPGTPPA